MNFTKEACLFVIKNIASIEGEIVETVQKNVFKAINARLESRIKAIGGWKGRYQLATGEADETDFAPVTWPESQDGRYRASYTLGESGDKNSYWLSNALGVNGVKLCFQFWVHGGLGGRSKGDIERKVITVSNIAAVKEAGMILDEDKALCLPFVFDAETLAAEYRGGILSNNTKVPPGGAVRFMIVFYKLPKAITDFSVTAIEARMPLKQARITE